MITIEKLENGYRYVSSTNIQVGLSSMQKFTIENWEINIDFNTNDTIDDISIDGLRIDNWIEGLLHKKILTNDSYFKNIDADYIRNVEYVNTTYISKLIYKILKSKIGENITDNSLNILINAN